MSLKEIRKKLFGPVVWGNLLAMVIVGVALFVGMCMWMSHYTMHGEGVDVPDVKGMTLGDATYALERLELVTVVVDSAYVREQPAGIVLEQKPGSGSRVKSGREIYLTINSRQAPTLAVPDIADNCSLREAEARLKAMGFKLGPIEYAPGDKDWVMAVKCRGRKVNAGERISIDDPVTLVVGNNADDSGDFDEDEGWEEDEPATLDETL